jgi:lipopolysaccharide/colanic/teichoic acid biosynthesis glycosyltransferase
MALSKKSGFPDVSMVEAGDVQYSTRLRAVATEPRAEFVWRDGSVRASVSRRPTRDRCLLLVEPHLFERACDALGVAEDGPKIVFSVGQEPALLRALLGGSLRETISAHSRRVLIAPSGRGAEEQMIELTVDSALQKATVSMPRVGLTRAGELTKRGFDLVIAVAAMLVILPLLALIALLVKLDSPGPILFRQTRVGRGGRAFRMLKFRTMVRDAEALKGGLLELNERDGLFKIREDPRITPVGRWLRQTSLDELPQLINVLRGEMSLVGPRPLVPDEDARIFGWRRRRLEVPPGMTGCWQVGPSRLSLDEMVVIDHLYSANWSLWTDIKCIVGTIPAMLRRRGF